MTAPAGAGLRRLIAALGGRAPARVVGWADAIERAPAPRDRGLIAAAAELEPALAYLVSAEERAAFDELLPQYPGILPEIRARLALGESPSAVAGGLSRAEAHAYLVGGAWLPPAEWLLRRELGQSHAVDCVEVARWLIEAYRDPPRREALERPRREFLAGRAVEGRYLDRVDELRRADLRGSVEETFRRASARLMRALEKTLKSRGEPLRGVPEWWRPVRCARLLRSGADLVREGRDLRHCVATYAEDVRSGRSVIIGLAVLGHRSTVEIRNGRVAQHRGLANSEPHPLCQRALAVCVRRWGLS